MVLNVTDRFFLLLQFFLRDPLKKRPVVCASSFILMLMNKIKHNGSQRQLVVVHLLLS